ncbi:hypothetical protein M0R45_014565 [Rubus argutus]|uniref:Seipin n=1 Tax=Rubus argutus TaxID=59490 RepID=A0AAW1XNC2_RUBAR
MEDSQTLAAHDLADNGDQGFSRTQDGGFEPKCDAKSQRLFHMLKCYMLKLALDGADKVFKDQRTLNSCISVFECRAGLARNHGDVRRCGLDSTQVCEEIAVEERRDEGFQLSLVVKLFTLPVWLSYFSFMLLLRPFQTLRHIQGYLMERLLRLWSATFTSVISAVSGGLGTQKSLVVIVGLALFRSIYVCSMLLGILASGFVLSGFTMRHLVEKPIKTVETLNFDYTKPSPVALVPLMSSGVGVIPYNHKLQMTVSLTLPESEYNHKLGVFQVRVEFLSANGKVTASSSYPCMLRFKSRPIHYMQTFLRSAPLIVGLQSETQVLNIKISAHTEGLEPTACLKVILEQRAECHSGEGIPQIYAGLLLLQSELPQLKRLVWYWRRTIFVWTSFVSFLAELVFILAFFGPKIVPRGRPEKIKKARNSIIFGHQSR